MLQQIYLEELVGRTVSHIHNENFTILIVLTDGTFTIHDEHGEGSMSVKEYIRSVGSHVIEKMVELGIGTEQEIREQLSQ